MKTLALPVIALALSGCAGDAGPHPLPTIKPEEEKIDASALAVFLDFEFDGELVTDSAWRPDQIVREQMLYTIGHLNGENSVGRLDRLELTDVATESVDGRTRITYHGRMPVAWGQRTRVPAEYTLRLPRDVSFSSLEAFTARYMSSCVDRSAHTTTGPRRPAAASILRRSSRSPRPSLRA
jgi:hypothetical protein